MHCLGDWTIADHGHGYCRYVNEPQDAELVLRWNADAPANATIPYDIEVGGHVTLFDDTEYGQPDEVEGVVHALMGLFGGPDATQPEMDPKTAGGGSP